MSRRQSAAFAGRDAQRDGHRRRQPWRRRLFELSLVLVAAYVTGCRFYDEGLLSYGQADTDGGDGSTRNGSGAGPSLELDDGSPSDGGMAPADDICATPCENDHGAAACENGTCVDVCSPGYGDCDGDAANGCETALDTTDHCGACGKSCQDDAVCDAGGCSQPCDLTGAYALRIELSVTWPQTASLMAGADAFVFWSKVEANHSGDRMALSLAQCGRSVPPVTTVVNERLQYGYPDGLFDSGVLSPVTATAMVGIPAVSGAPLTLPAVAFVMGTSLRNPAAAFWPGAANGLYPRDDDMDGRPGVTAVYESGNGFVYPLTAVAFDAPRTNELYVATRLVYSLSGTLDGCTRSTGSARVTQLNTRVFGCKLAYGAMPCNPYQAGFLDANCINYGLEDASYTLVKIDDNASCPEIRSALP